MGKNYTKKVMVHWFVHPFKTNILFKFEQMIFVFILAFSYADHESESLMSEVLDMMETTKLVQMSPIYDHANYPHITLDRHNELKMAFLNFDEEKSGKIKTAGIMIDSEC